MVFTRENIRRDLPICVVASAMLLLFALYVGAVDGIGRLEGAIMLACYIGVTYFSIVSAKKDAPDADAGTGEESSQGADMAWGRIIIYIIVGLAGLIYGGNTCLESATSIARAWGVSEAVIAITIVAAGTSLPELASSLVAIFKGRASLALGNVLGSNIANILLILGLCGSISPLSMGDVTMIDVYVVVAAATLVMISALVIGRDKMTRFEGVIFLLCYVAYIYYLISK
jgi:cation:H+ antiporter